MINKMKEINKSTTFAELIRQNPNAAFKLAEKGLFCGGCAMAQFETIEQGAMAHGLNPDELIADLDREKKIGKKKLKSKGKKEKYKVKLKDRVKKTKKIKKRKK
jgi:hybrid cluster-associated redox disulfide protein